MARYRFSGLRGRLALVVLLAVLPLLALLLYGNWELRQVQRAEAEKDVLSLVTMATNEQERLIEGARQLLTGLAQLPQLGTGDPQVCSEFLAGLLAQYRVYANLGVVGADGEPLCLARPVPRPIDIAERGWFREAVSERRFTMGDYQIGQVSGRPTVVFAYPLPEAAAGAVLIASLDVGWLGEFLREAELPAGSTLNAIDGQGTVLVRYPDPDAWTGRRLPEAPLIRSIVDSRDEGVTRAEGLDGVSRVYAHAPLPSLEGPSGAYLSVGIPVSDVFAETRSAFVRNLLGIALVLLLAGVAVTLGGRWLVIRPVEAVVRSMRLFARGHRESRAPVLTRDEIGEVARAFNEMADDLDQVYGELERRVEERTAELIVANEAVEERRRTLEALLESLPVGVFLVRAPGGEPELVNRVGAEIMGLEKAEAGEMRGWESRYRHEREDGTPYLVEELPLSITLATGEPASAGDIHVVQEDGSRIALRASSAPIRDARGVMRLAVVVFEDTTRERQLDRAKDEFVALASHQLRTPATGVKAYLSMLLDGDVGPLGETQEEFVARAYESNEHGLALIEDLLAVTRIESGRYVAEIEPVDLGALVEDVVEEQRETIRRRGQTVRYERPAGPVVLPVDPRKLRMAIGNLVDNASKYTSRGGRVDVAVARSNGVTTIVVEDDGVGIEAESMEKLFGRFSRIDHPRADEVGGTGLGLYLVKKIVDLHRGEVLVESEPGEGSIFTIRLRSG